MGLTNQTAMIIATNDDETVWADAGGPDEDGKFAGYIMFGEHHRILVSTPAAYDSAEEAKEGMRSVIQRCRKEWPFA